MFLFSAIFAILRENTILSFFGLATLYITAVVGYRLTLHPLASVPGPVLAAATGAYEAYFQLFKDGGGRYWVEVDRLHDIYGARMQPPLSQAKLTRHAYCCRPHRAHQSMGSPYQRF